MSWLRNGHFWQRALLAAVVFIVGLLVAQRCGADVTPVSASSGKDTSGASTTLTLSGVNCGAGNFCKFTLVWRQLTTETANTPTYAGSSSGIITIVPTIGGMGASDGCANGGCVKTWYACNLTGTQNVVFSVSAASNMFGGVVVYSGVDCAGTPVGTSIQNDSLDLSQQDTVSTNITVGAGGIASDSLYIRDDVEAVNVAAMGQILETHQSDTGSISMWISDEPASTNMSWTWTPQVLDFVHIVTPINAGAGGGGGGGGTVSYLSSASTKDISGAASMLDLAGVNCGAGNFCRFVMIWRQLTTEVAATPTYGGSSTGVTAIVPTIGAMGSATGCVSGACLKTWYACNLTGTQTVRFSVTGGGGVANMFVAAHVYGGVDCAGTPTGTSVQNDSDDLGNAASVSTNVTSTSGGMAVDALYIRDDAPSTFAVAGQTQREAQSDAGSIGLWTSDKPTATTMGWDWTGEMGSLPFVHIATPLNAGAGGGGGSGGCKGSMTLLRVGGC